MDHAFTIRKWITKHQKEKPVPVESLCKKTIYHSPEEAQDMIGHINENRIAGAIRAYRCPVCGFCHLTSKSE